MEGTPTSQIAQRSFSFLTTLARRLAADCGGTSVIEFAMVGPMLLLLMASIIDLGMMLTTQSLLDGAARDAARLIRTGQVQTAGSPITTFRNLLCSGMTPVMSTSTCQASVLFEVQTFSTFGGVSFTPCTQNTDPAASGYCPFSAGIASQIVGVKVSYARPFIVPWVGACLTNGYCWVGMNISGGSGSGGGTALLTSTVIFRNEPFPS